jgi:hypothetical protein
MVDDTNEITHVPPESQAESTLHRDIQAELDRIPDWVNRLKAANRFMLLGTELEGRYPETYLSTRIWAFDAQVIISFKFASMAQATEVLRYLATVHNLHHKDKVWIYANDKSLNWSYNGFRLTGHFNADSARCKFVQTGTRLEPVYEMRCDDSATHLALENQ